MRLRLTLAVCVAFLVAGAERAQCEGLTERSAPVPQAAESAGAAALGLRGTLPVPVKAEPQVLDHTKGQAWRRASMHLTGSMCPACLLDLENKLQRMNGVAFTKIDRQAGLVAQNEPAPKAREAAMIIIYDSNATTLQELLHTVKGEKYKPLNVEETVK